MFAEVSEVAILLFAPYDKSKKQGQEIDRIDQSALFPHFAERQRQMRQRAGGRALHCKQLHIRPSEVDAVKGMRAQSPDFAIRKRQTS